MLKHASADVGAGVDNDEWFAIPVAMGAADNWQRDDDALRVGNDRRTRSGRSRLFAQTTTLSDKSLRTTGEQEMNPDAFERCPN